MKKRPLPPKAAPSPRRRKGARAAPLLSPPTFLQYKVVELSTVDEGSLERSVNEWTQQGFSLDGVQFAMRESSKRPAMAFLFFTRESEALSPEPERARARLRQLAEGESRTAPPRALAPRATGRERLAQLAGLTEGPDGAE